MTTIVVDRVMGYVAADRQVTENCGDIVCEMGKIRTTDVGDILASSGMEGPAVIAEDWWTYSDDLEPDPLSLEPGDEFITSVLSHNGELFVFDRWLRPWSISDRWYCHGTGGPLAWAVLVAGAGIDNALRAACKLDPFSGVGYDIVWLDGRREQHLF